MLNSPKPGGSEGRERSSARLSPAAFTSTRIQSWEGRVGHGGRL